MVSFLDSSWLSLWESWRGTRLRGLFLIKQMFVITEMDAGCGVHLKAHRAVLRLDRDGAALAAFQDTGKLAHAVGGGADEVRMPENSLAPFSLALYSLTLIFWPCTAV